MSIADLASIILAVSTTVSLLYVARQLRVAQRQTKGQFLLALDDQFIKSRPIMQQFVLNRDLKPEGDQWPQIWALMSVFERINIMVDDKILDVAIVDRLHGFALMGLIANDAVYQRLLATGAEWQDFIDLCRTLARHRRSKAVGPHHKVFLERVKALDKEARQMADPWQY